MLIKRVNTKNGKTKEITFNDFIEDLEKALKEETGINENYARVNKVKINFELLNNETIKAGEYEYSRIN